MVHIFLQNVEVVAALAGAPVRFKVKGAHQISISDSQRGSGLPTHALLCLWFSEHGLEFANQLDPILGNRESTPHPLSQKK